MKSEWALESITKRRLRLSDIAQLNDPFELIGPGLDDPPMRRKVADWKNKFAERYGLISFSEKCSNPVLWGHYADGHRGMCLGFEVPAEQLLRVQYQSRRLPPAVIGDMIVLEREQEAMRRILCTKFSHWRYEREWRSF